MGEGILTCIGKTCYEFLWQETMYAKMSSRI